MSGAGSKEFHDIIRNYYNESQDNPASSSLFGPNLSPQGLTRSFYEKVWDWVTEQPDVRIYHKQKTHRLSLSEFEALEAQAKENSPNGPPPRQQWEPSGYSQATAAKPASRPSDTLLSLRGSLRERLLAEGSQQVNTPAGEPGRSDVNLGSSSNMQPQVSLPAVAARSTSILAPTTLNASEVSTHSLPEAAKVQSRLRGPRKIPKGLMIQESIFDEPPSSLTVPRLFASQNRIWQAVAGHSMDLKKIPAMEFVLLCIIATHRSEGITQPALIKMSGQDKRSVPKRTDSLSQKGYIEKKPCTDGRLHTSMCVHKKYAKDDNGLSIERTIDDVFGEKRFIVPGFIYLLHKLLSEAGGVVPTRELRKRLVKIPPTVC
jgi:hypothetical protein